MKKMALLAAIAVALLSVFACQNPVHEDPKSGNADLAALSVASGELSPAFSAATTAYSLAVANSTTTVVSPGRRPTRTRASRRQ